MVNASRVSRLCTTETHISGYQRIGRTSQSWTAMKYRERIIVVRPVLRSVISGAEASVMLQCEARTSLCTNRIIEMHSPEGMPICSLPPGCVSTTSYSMGQLP